MRRLSLRRKGWSPPTCWVRARSKSVTLSLNKRLRSSSLKYDARAFPEVVVLVKGEKESSTANRFRMNVSISWNILPSISVSEPLQYQEMKHIHQVWKHTLTTALFRIHYCMFGCHIIQQEKPPRASHQKLSYWSAPGRRPLARSHQVLRSKTNVPISQLQLSLLKCQWVLGKRLTTSFLYTPKQTVYLSMCSRGCWRWETMTPIASPSSAAALKVRKYSSCWGMLLVDGSTGIVMNTITFTVQQLWGKEE